MKLPFKTAALAIGVVMALAAPANAVVCTGSTMALGNGGTATGAFLLVPGNCVSVSDKIFGEFAVGDAILGTGTAQWSFVNSPGNVTVAFLGTVQPGQVGNIDYAVEVDETIAPGWTITSLTKDLNVNAVTTGLFASATLTGGITFPFVQAYNCNRTTNPSGGTCPETHSFAGVDEIRVSQVITTDLNAVVGSVIDTIGQTAVPEPGSLAMLIPALLGAGFILYRRRDNGAGTGAAA